MSGPGYEYTRRDVMEAYGARGPRPRHRSIPVEMNNNGLLRPARAPHARWEEEESEEEATLVADTPEPEGPKASPRKFLSKTLSPKKGTPSLLS